jgi:molecular chaperone HscB
VRNLVLRVSPCWQCGKPTSEALFCSHCNALQPPPADYYLLLGIKEDQLNLNLDDLQRRFYELSRLLHPDRFMRKPEIERQYSLDAASVLNDAYRSLRDPVKRALYVLKKHGFEIGEQKSKDVPPELLEEVFELNMALEEMRAGDDSARPQLEEAEQNFTSMLQTSGTELEGQFAAYDAAPGDDKLLQIRAVLNRRKYIQNLVNQVHEHLSN